MTRVLESVFFAFPVTLLGIHFILRQRDRYRRSKREVQVQIRYFNYIHFAFDHKLFPDHYRKAGLEPRDFAEMDRDINLKTELLHKKPAAYQDFLKIMNGMADMKSSLHSAIVGSAVLAWFVAFFATP